MALARRSRNDRITLAGIQINPRIGTTAEERTTPQDCEVDLSVWGDFEAAAATDSLDKSVDYCRLLSLVQEIAHMQEYELVETLAYKVVRTVLQKFPVNRANVKLRKQPAGLRGQIHFVEVEVEEE
jgi:7,8-dihydroneopterin aldolase/epimerase/oxygenase